MDLIREAIGGVGGEVTMTSKPGSGTSVLLSVPATLSALDGLLVSAGGEPYALPLSSVVRSLRVAVSGLTLTADGPSLLFEERALPFVPLAWLMQRGAARDDQRAVWSVLVLDSEGEQIALGVDRLLGSESLVARSLPSSAQLDATVAGVTLDTEGNPRLLLDPEALLNAARSLPRRTPSARPSRRAILVIDDSLTTRMLEQSILESAGYEVELATSGEQGLEKARARRFDMLLVDVEMPGMDGFTFVEQVRADPRLSKTPTMLVTSRVSPEDLARGKAAGADGHIAKGEFDQVDFLERIDRLTR
jgi:two-component system chemotaxis sensor kinase CheA